jgi:hypothetical protein
LAYCREIAEISSRRRSREDNGKGVGKGMLGISLQEMKGKDVENGGITEEELFFFRFIQVFLDSRAPAEKASRGFDARKIVSEHGRGGCRKHREPFVEAREFWCIRYPVEPVKIFLKMVITELVADKKHDQEAAGQADSQTQDIDEANRFAFTEVANGDEQVVFDHWSTFSGR